MAKQLDWSQTQKTPLRGKRGDYSSRKEQLEKSYEKLREQEVAKANFLQLEPHLRKALLDAMVNREPITVIRPISYLTEGIKKSVPQDEMDAAFYNHSRSSDEAALTFEIQRQVIEPGTQLAFSHIDNQLGKWIFKSSKGGEIELYGTPTIQVPGRGGMLQEVPNEGFWGLMTNTNIYQDLVSEIEDLNVSEPAE